MFHRVLEPSDARWHSCDPDYTLSAKLFGDCLTFFRRHYNVVSTQAVREAARGGARLPPRPLLITFDDGWSDNAHHALPRLQAAGMPALLFTVADAVDRKEPFFQERIISAVRAGRLPLEDFAATLRSEGISASVPNGAPLRALRPLIAALESADSLVLQRVVDALEPRLRDGLSHMVTRADLATLARGGVEIGLHGKTHGPMTRASDLDAELGGARVQVAAMLEASAAPTTMSFPHGKYDERIATRARESGFELVFTSVPALNPTEPKPGWLLARLGFETDTIADARGRFRPDWLALYLFRRPRKVLARG